MNNPRVLFDNPFK